MELIEFLPVAVIFVDVHEGIQLANEKARDFPGLRGAMPKTLAELDQLLQLFTVDGTALCGSGQHPVRCALRGESYPTQELLARCSNVPPCWLEVDAKPVRDEGRNLTGALLTWRDITDRKRKSNAAEAESDVQKFLNQENLAGLIHTSVDGRILYVNGAIVRMLGYESREELMAMRAQQLYCDAEDRDKLLRRIAAGSQLDRVELRFRSKDGGTRWGLLSIRVIAPGVGEVGGSFISSVLDITDRKKWEDSLRQSEQRFSTFMRNLPGVAFVKDLEGRYTYYNEAAKRLFNLSPAEIIGKKDEEVWPPEAAACFRANDSLVVDYLQPVETVEPVPHGSVVHSWLINKFPIVESGAVVGVGGVGIDITERVHLEDQLTQSRKMEALGRLAGGIAHDFNNLLTVISGYGQLAFEGIKTAKPEQLSAYVQEILNSSRRAAGLTSQLLAFSRRQNVQQKVVDLGELLHSMELLLERVIGEHVDLQVRCDSTPCLVRADPHQLEQVVMNLCVNARDAMPLGGILDIECSVLPDNGGQEILLLVRDTGVGMNASVQEHLFEPFYTSKEKGKGTGLGLSTVYGIVTQAGGRIKVESEPGAGACFRIYLPLEKDPGAITRITQDSTRSRTGTETILLVEDELSVRELAREILQRLGYNVLVADSGRAALEIWEDQRGHIDLLLTDVIMPHMSGADLARRLRDKNPQLRILFMSGYTDDMIANQGLDGTQLLSKPFSADALSRKLRELLEA